MSETAQPEQEPESVNPMQKAVDDRNVLALCDSLFGEQPTEKQQDVIRTIAFQESDRSIVLAPTRYGKTYSLALGVALLFVFNDRVTVNEIAPTQDQTKKFRQYLLQFVSNSQVLDVQGASAGADAERLQKEASQYRITFTGGNEINFLTAGGQNDAQGLMGEGADVVIADESCDIDDEVYQKRIFRQIEDSEDGTDVSMYIEIGNPWEKSNHFFRHYNDPDYKNIEINYRHAIDEGRLSQSTIEEARKELQPHIFKVLYEAQFPDEVEDALIKHSWVDNDDEEDPGAKQRSYDLDDPAVSYGLDVAGEGDDEIVLTRVENEGDKWRQTDVWSKAMSRDTGVTANWAKKHIEDRERQRLPTEDETFTDEDVQKALRRVEVHVDAVGIGNGVWSKLNEYNIFDVQKFKAGKSPTRESDKFRDQKAQYYWKLRDILQDGDIDIDEDAPRDLILELTHLKTERTARDKMKIVDPDSGSPDYSDSLMMALALDSGITIGGIS